MLGTGAALSDPHRTTTMLALENEDGIVMVDCGGDALQRLLSCGGDPSRIRALIVTHEHADHVSGFPLLMERLWLSGLREPLEVYGIAPAIDQARRVHDAFDTSGWPDYPGVRYHLVPEEEGALVFTGHGWTVNASPGRHAVPVVGLRFVDESTKRVAAYSCDTEYHQPIVRLAREADLLVHEATGEGTGHSSAVQAATAAAEAHARKLLLVHLPPERLLGEGQLAAAREIFPEVEKAEEGRSYQF